MAGIVDIIDNTKEALKAIDEARERGLEKCGLKAEGYAKKNLTANKSVDTGNLRNSITHQQVGNAEYIGSRVKYAPYVELGTGIHATGGSGAKKIPWVYRDGEGNFHRTFGQPPKPFMKPAAADHAQEYRDIMKEALKGK